MFSPVVTELLVPRYAAEPKAPSRKGGGVPVVIGKDQALVMISTNSLRIGAKNGVSACHHHMLPRTSGR